MSAPSAVSVPSSQASEDFSTFITNFRAQLRDTFRRRGDIDAMSLQRGLPPYVLRDVRSCKPLSAFIPSEYGGRGGHVHESLSVLQAAGYESIALTLTLGINGALFIQPVSKYAKDEVKGPIFERFLEHQHMGGLMITEPDYGSDALSMQTGYTEHEDYAHLQGTKHWAGLTSWADFWLLTARKQDADGNLARDIDIFICDVTDPEQHIEVEELYTNLGLYHIPYGRNRLDAKIPYVQQLVPERTGITMLLDLLHRSRIQFPGMGMGFLQRMLDEALAHCRGRHVGGRSLLNYDQVKSRLSTLQAYFTACSAMCAHASEHAGLEHNLSKISLQANAVKTVVTDMMQEAADSVLQLTGAKGYMQDHIVGRGYVDSRPFQIFEGSNDILYQQITEAVLKSMRRLKDNNLYNFLQQSELTARASDQFKDTLNITLDPQMPQRKLVELGRVLARIISMEFIIELGERGFRSDLISNSLAVFRRHANRYLCAYRDEGLPEIVEDYADDSAWVDLVKARS